MSDENPGFPMQTLVTRLNVHRTTVLRAIHEDLQYKNYVLKERQMLSQAMKVKRLQRYELLIASLKDGAAGRVRFFSDEKIFTVDAKINSQNDRLLCKDPDDVPVISTIRFLVGVHVLEVIFSEEVMPLNFFGKGQNVMKEVNLDVMKTGKAVDSSVSCREFMALPKGRSSCS